MRKLVICLVCSMTVLLSACGPDNSLKSKYPEIAWEELKPNNSNLTNQNSGLKSLEVVDDRYATEQYSQLSGLSSGYVGEPPHPYAFGIVPEINGKTVRVPGFIVPVEFESENLATEFFLVPYFGACFHKPPPPPNQTIYVSSAKPIKYSSIYDPVWIMGVIKTEQIGNEIATAAYRMEFHQLEPFMEY